MSENPKARLPGGQVYAELGLEGKADWAVSWPNPACPWLPRCAKGLVWLLPCLVLFRLVVHPLQPGVVGPYPVWGTLFPSRLLLEETGP
jgi:hypothetical protein